MNDPHRWCRACPVDIREYLAHVDAIYVAAFARPPRKPRSHRRRR